LLYLTVKNREQGNGAGTRFGAGSKRQGTKNKKNKAQEQEQRGAREQGTGQNKKQSSAPQENKLKTKLEKIRTK
jgi:hypothetical protein